MKKRMLSLGITLLCFNVFSQPLFEDLPPTGEIEVALHPGSSVNTGSSQLVSFGIPFPRNTVTSISQIMVTDDQGNELASDIKELVRWHSLSDDPNVDGVRAAAIFVNIQFDNLNPQVVKVMYGQNRTLELGAQGDVKDNWVIVTDPQDEYIDDTNNAEYTELREPPVYATLPPEWMSTCVIRSRFVPASSSSSNYQWLDTASFNYGNKAIDGAAINMVTNEPWLFDRAGTLWNLYVKTGELKWLKSAHKASQFYASYIHPEGYFILKGRDLKYSYGGSMLIDIIMTGDLSLKNEIENVASFANSQNIFLQDGFRFWTERHYAYWLLAALSAYEATGDTTYKNQVMERVDHAFLRAKNPVNGYIAEGGILHPKGPHEGDNDPGQGNPDPTGYYQAVISPWMSALLADAVWRYYLHSEDSDALEFLVDLGNHVVNGCLYEPSATLGDHPQMFGRTMPYYLGSGQIDNAYLTENGLRDDFRGPWRDYHHALDVSGLLSKAYWAAKKTGRNATTIGENVLALNETSQFTFSKTPNLNPPREFNWWFGTTSDLEWLMKNNPGDVLSVNDFGEINTGTFAIYPNPASHHITISATNTVIDTKGKIEIFDIAGKSLKTSEIQDLRKNPIVVIDNLSSGIYFIQIKSSNQKQQTIKLIKN